MAKRVACSAIPLMASCPRASRLMGSLLPLRFIQLGQKGITSAWSFARGHSLNARLHCFRRKNLIDFTAHDLIAFACRFFEPRPVNLDHASPIGSDSTRRPGVAHNMSHSRSSYSNQLRKRLLRQRQDVTINSILDVEQPPGHAGLDG